MTESTQSRSWRKFVQHRPALIASVIIATYVLVALSVMITGWITLDDTNRRVGPPNVPGFGLQPDAEQRMEIAEHLAERIESLCDRKEPVTALREFRDLGSRRLADLSVEQFQEHAESVWEVYDQLAKLENVNDAVVASESSARVNSLLSDLDARCEQFLLPVAQTGSTWRTLELLLGTDRQGRSIFLRAVYSIRVAIMVGLVTGVMAVLIGTLTGLAAGYFGGVVDGLISWLYSTFASIPSIVLLIVLAFMFAGGDLDQFINSYTGNLLRTLVGGRLDETLIPVYISFAITYWIGPCRVIRGETLKIKELEYVQAAVVMGYGRTRILLRHVLPNVTHLMLISFSLLFIGAIKSEVILSYLGLGVQNGPSWGLMISQSSQEVMKGFFWQIGTATAFMFVLVLAFNILTDALQDVFDPKHV